MVMLSIDLCKQTQKEFFGNLRLAFKLHLSNNCNNILSARQRLQIASIITRNLNHSAHVLVEDKKQCDEPGGFVAS